MNQQYEQPRRRPPQPGQRRSVQPGQQYPGQPGQRYSGQPGQQYPAQPGQQYPAQPGQRYPGQPGQQRPVNPRRRRRKRHPYAHLVKPGLIALGVLLLILLIVDLVSFRIVVDADRVYYAEYGESFTLPDPEARVKGGLFGLSWKAKATTEDQVDTDTLGTYELTYKIKGTAFVLIFPRTIETTVTQTVVVRDTAAPVITLKESGVASTYPGAEYVEEGYTAVDAHDGDVTANVTSYQENGQVFYSVTDSSGNTGTAVRTILYREGVQSNGKTIYLTFDDGPGKYTEELLDVLAKYNVKVTFFVVGTDYVNIMTRIAEEGHAIGVHSYTHRLKLIYQGETQFYDDMEKMQELIVKYTGKRTNLLRFPGGSSNMLSDYNPGIMTRMAKSVQEHGYVYFDWNVDSFDAGGAETPEEVFENVKAGVESRENSVVLQHDIKEYSVDAVERIIVWGLENGYTFRPLDENAPTCHHKISN